MKVTRNTQDLLIVEDRPLWVALLLSFFFLASVIGALGAWFSGEWLAGVALSLSAAFLALFMRLIVRRVQVIFDRPQATLTLRSRNLSGYLEVVHPLGDLSHAIKEGHDTARCVLVFHKGMSEGHHPVTQYSTSGLAPQRITDAINLWLKEAHALDSQGPSA